MESLSTGQVVILVGVPTAVVILVALWGGFSGEDVGDTAVIAIGLGLATAMLTIFAVVFTFWVVVLVGVAAAFFATYYLSRRLGRWSNDE